MLAGPAPSPRAASPSVDDAAAQPCPICLTHIEDERSKAIVLDCLHVFCVPCISRWAKLRRECPLCKGFFKAYIHDIVSATSFKERCLSPLRPQDSKDVAASEDTIQALLRDAREQYTSWQASQPRHGTGGRQHQQHQHSHHSGARHRSNPERRGLTEPRPYYFRLQRNLAARAGLDAYGQTCPAETPADETLEWRRSIYTRNLWALPVRVAASGGTPPPNASAPAGEQRLQDWVARELLALLHQEDVLIVKGLVLSLVRSHGLASPHGGSTYSASSTSTSQRHVSPADALRPFLHEHAEHFWHELRNFASAPFTIITYDRTVRYGSPGQATGSGEASDSATAPAPTGRSSRWDVQPVRHARPSINRCRQQLQPAASGVSPHQEAVQARQASEPQPAEPPASSVEADNSHSSRDQDINSAAQSAAELLALRRRAMRSVRGRSGSDEPVSRQARNKQRHAASKSPDIQHGQRRQAHRRVPALSAEPQHRKRHGRRQSYSQHERPGIMQSTAPVAALLPSDSTDCERWEMG